MKLSHPGKQGKNRKLDSTLDPNNKGSNIMWEEVSESEGMINEMLIHDNIYYNFYTCMHYNI